MQWTYRAGEEDALILFKFFLFSFFFNKKITLSRLLYIHIYSLNEVLEMPIYYYCLH